jgi:hypothetical protein
LGELPLVTTTKHGAPLLARWEEAVTILCIPGRKVGMVVNSVVNGLELVWSIFEVFLEARLF